MAAVIIPAVEGTGDSFLLFYPAISMGVDIPGPLLWLAVVLEELESGGSHPVTRAVTSGCEASSHPVTSGWKLPATL